MWAIRSALKAGATAIELDVHCTADGHLVVCHDDMVDRTTNGHGAIASMTLEELRVLDNAYWFVPGADATPGRPADAYPLRGRAPKDKDLRIATLEEVLEEFPSVVLNLDIKQTAPDVVPYEAKLADLLRCAGRTSDVIVASFHDSATDAFSAIAPEIATSAGTNLVTQLWRASRDGSDLPATRHVAVQVPARMGSMVVVDEIFVAAMHDHGLAVHVWTINDQEQMESLVGLGVDGIITDRPSLLAKVLDRLGAAWVG